MKSRTGAIAVIRSEKLFLVIERSQTVTAPGMFCFPGGGVEQGEEESHAVVRELNEELGLVDTEPIRCLWQSQNGRGTHLKWWLTVIREGSGIIPNPAEVASCHWWTLEQMLSEERLLTSNREFLDALRRGEFTLDPTVA